jgi:hypothetical protein
VSGNNSLNTSNKAVTILAVMLLAVLSRSFSQDSTVVPSPRKAPVSEGDTLYSDSGTAAGEMTEDLPSASEPPIVEDSLSAPQPDFGVGDGDSSGAAAADSSNRALSLPQDSSLSSNPDSVSDSAVKPAKSKKKQLIKLKKKRSEREKAFRESRINTIDEMKGRYRSPKKAMFMSLVLPGLGQAYVGHYIRGSGYFLIDAALIAGWRHYVIVKHDRQVRRYRNFADLHWSHAEYEDSIAVHYSDYQNSSEEIKKAHSTRESFCNAVFPDGSTERQTCVDFGHEKSGGIDYQDQAVYIWAQKERDYHSRKKDDPRGYTKTLSDYRDNTMQDLRTFYELIGKHNEYVTGWDDADSVSFDTSFVNGFSEHRISYRKMRAKATEYSRMQTWFLGGIVLNHLVSALDAAIAARLNNKKLYQTEVKWYDRVRLESFLALDRNRMPVPTVLAHFFF